MEVYGTEQQKIFQILAAVEEKTVISVIAGEIGFQKEFEDPKDPLINRILEFCKTKDFVKLGKSIKMDTFFK